MRIALLIAEALVSDAPDRRADAHVFDSEFTVLVRAMAAQGMTLEAVRWMGERNWRDYAAVLVKNAWDYQDQPEAFLARIEGIAAAGVPVFNPPALVRWNLRKTYLRNLAARGVATLPTLWPGRPVAADIAEAFALFGGDALVLKRQIGAGARSQMRIARGQALPEGPLLDRAGMIQPLIPAITTEGEFSFLFIDGAYSHTVLKRPRAGDYRIQEAYGGQTLGIEPAAADLASARAVLAALEEAPLYARVDMVRAAEGHLMLMELEVIEPSLFVEAGEGIGDMLAAAMRRRLG
jgi:hypothetical protein